MSFELIEIGPERIGLLRELAFELHRHERDVQPALGHAPARQDDEYWRLYSSRFGEWFRDGDGCCFVAHEIGRDAGGGAPYPGNEGPNDAVIGFVFGIVKESDTAYDTGGDRIGYIEEIAVLEFYSRLGLRPAARLMIGRTRDDGLADASPGDG